MSALLIESDGVTLKILFFPAGNVSEEQVRKDTAMQHPAS